LVHALANTRFLFDAEVVSAMAPQKEILAAR
jgi:hypothetical protein